MTRRKKSRLVHLKDAEGKGQCIVADPCVQTTKLLRNFSSGTALLTHWRSTLPEEKQPGVSLQQNILGDCRLSKCNSIEAS